MTKNVIHGTIQNRFATDQTPIVGANFHLEGSAMMRRILTGLGVLLGLVGAHATLAGPAGLHDGIYDAFNCAAEVSDTRIKISGNTASFYETFCELSTPQTLRGLPRAVLLDAQCEGEAQTWTTRFIMLQTHDGGLSMMDESWGDHYARCN